MPQSCKMMHTCHFLESNCFEKASSSSPGCSPCVLCGRWVCARPSNTACPSSLCTSSGWCPPTTAASCLEGPAGPAWRREGGPSVPSPATWLPRGEGGVEGDGAEEAGQREKETIPLLFLALVFSQAFCSVIRSFPPLYSCFHTLSLSPPT